MAKRTRSEQKRWSTFYPATLPAGSPPKPQGTRVWLSEFFQVVEIELPDGWTWLSIKRLDKAILRDWRELQFIKNELCGPDREALELFPREDRVTDTSNQYHLWVLPAGYYFPRGYLDRDVVDGDGKLVKPGKPRQRPLPDWMICKGVTELNLIRLQTHPEDPDEKDAKEPVPED